CASLRGRPGEAVVVHGVRTELHPVRVRAVSQVILSSALPYDEVGIETGNEWAMGNPFEQLFQRPARHQKSRIAADHDRGAGTPAGSHGLPIALGVPAVDEKGIEPLSPDDIRDLRGIAAAKRGE